MRRLAVLVTCSLLFLLAGCEGSGSGSTAHQAAGTPGLPTASGSYGDKPTLKFPAGKAPAKLEKKVLHAGTGPAVAKGDLLVADYLGQIWKGKVFDNSYDRKQPAAFPIGVGQVIPGWDKTLVGVKAGSRVLLSIPPADGYGSSGNTDAGIKGTDTLVFVVDVIEAFSKSAHGDPHATPQHVPAGHVRVTGALGAQPTVTVPKGMPKPTKPSVTLLAKGHGTPVKPGLIVVQYEAVDWTGKQIGSTWANGAPTSFPVGNPTQPSGFDALEGMPVGSRVLLEAPEQKGQSPALAIALDIVAQPLPAKQHQG